MDVFIRLASFVSPSATTLVRLCANLTLIGLVSYGSVVAIAESSDSVSGSFRSDSVNDSTVSIPQFSRLSSLLDKASREHKPIMLLFTQVDCPYCEALKRNAIQPLLVKEGESRLLIREIHRDYNQPLPDDDTVESIKKALNIHFYPSIALVDAEGHQLTDPLIGYQPDNDFFDFYLDQAIEKAIGIVQEKQTYSQTQP